MKMGLSGTLLGVSQMLVVAGMMAAAPAFAADGTGKNGVFTIHNETEGNTVVGFYTNDGSGWSTN